MCTILWNYRPTSSPTVPISSCEISPLLSVVFIYKHTHFHIWKCTVAPENSAQWCHQQWSPMLSSPMHPTALSEWLQPVQKMTSFLLELGLLTPLQTQKIYPYHISFTKYILRPCQHKKYIPKVWQWHLRVHSQKYILTAFHWQNIFCRCDTDIIIFVLHFRVHVSKIFFRFPGFLWANIYIKYI